MRRFTREEEAAAGAAGGARWVPTPTKVVDNGPFQDLFASAPGGCKGALFGM
jgi:hypothetical protein